MQPNQPYASPPPPPPSMPAGPQQPLPPSQPNQPNYDFLYQQPPKIRRFPFPGNSFLGKIVFILVGLVVLVIILVVIKGLLTTQPFNKSDYLLLVNRQQEMIHILSTDVTNSTVDQLSPTNQNFVVTAKASIITAQFKTLTFMADSKDRINTQRLMNTFSSSIDQSLNNSQSSNSFDSVFSSVMHQQLSLYKQSLSSAYNSTTSGSGRSLLRNEYSEANLLIKALGS